MNKNGSVVTAPATPSSSCRSTSISGVSGVTSPNINLFQEIVIRLMLFAFYFYFEWKEAFVRVIHPEEMWLYKNPISPSYVPLTLLYPAVFGLVGLVIIGYFVRSRDFHDFRSAWLGFSLACTLNGALTDVIKVAVGRPRPDFFQRCFPDGQMNEDMVCTGDPWTVKDGRKSFPSGHSSFSFAALGFLSWYLFAKLHAFTERGRGQTWRLLAAGGPLFAALMVSISRTCDYHHHWQDVTVGSLIGLTVGYLSYRQYYPPIGSRHCFVPYGTEVLSPSSNRKPVPKRDKVPDESESDTKTLLEGEDKDSKWT